MALKKLIDVGEAFPKVKRARLGAAPAIEDVLDNVGTPEPAPVLVTPAQAIEAPPPAALSATEPLEVREVAADPQQPRPQKRAEPKPRRAGQGTHKGSGTDARRYRKSGRTFQFGARTKPDFAEAIKKRAGDMNVTIGELLEDMMSFYEPGFVETVKLMAMERKKSVGAVLAEMANRYKTA